MNKGKSKSNSKKTLVSSEAAQLAAKVTPETENPKVQVGDSKVEIIDTNTTNKEQTAALIQQAVSQTEILPNKQIESSKKVPYQLSDFAPRLRDAFFSRYRLAQSATGKYLYSGAEPAIGDFSTVTEFIARVVELVYLIESQYRGIILDIPTQKLEANQPVRTTAPEAKGWDWTAFGRESKSAIVRNVLATYVDVARPRNDYVTPSRTTESYYWATAARWERALMQYLSEFEAHYYFAGDIAGSYAVPRARTIMDYFNYLSSFNSQLVPLHPDDGVYAGSFGNLTSRTPWVELTDDFAYLMAASISFRANVFQRHSSYFTDIFKDLKIERRPDSMAVFGRSAQVSTVRTGPMSSVLLALNSSVLQASMPSFASICAFSQYIRLSGSLHIGAALQASDIVSLILERLLFKSCIVSDHWKTVNAILVILHWFVHFAVDTSDAIWTISYWNNWNAGDPIAQAIGKILPALQQPFANYFAYDENTGSGWAGAGLSGNSIYQRVTRLAATQYREPYTDQYYNGASRTVVSQQYKFLIEMANALEKRGRVVSSSSAYADIQTITTVLSYLTKQQESVGLILGLLSMTWERVTYLPLALPSSDVLAYRIIPNRFSTIELGWQNIDKASWVARSRLATTNYIDLPVEVNLASTTALSMVCSNILVSTEEIMFTPEICYIHWGMNYALDMLAKCVVGVYLSTALAPGQFSTANFKAKDMRDMYWKQFDAIPGIDSNLKADVKLELFTNHVLPPISNTTLWTNYWTEIINAVKLHANDLGYTEDGLYYGDVTPLIDVGPDSFINVLDDEREPDDVVDELALRSGQDSNAIKEAFKRSRTAGRLLHIKVPVRISAEQITDGAVIGDSKSSFNGLLLQEPLDFPSSTSYSLLTYQIERLSQDSIAHSLNAKIAPMFFAVKDDPVETIEQADFEQWFTDRNGRLTGFSKWSFPGNRFTYVKATVTQIAKSIGVDSNPILNFIN